MKKHIRRIAAFLCLCFLFLSVGTVSAYNIPSLFHNDEAWYKDSFAPLIKRAGKFFVPAELFGMFDYIEVTSPTDDNLLIYNSDTGAYVSVLFMERRAAVNGNIVTEIDIFRDEGTYYVDTEFICSVVGVNYETYTADNGEESLRLYDGDKIFSMETLAESFMSEENDFAGDSPNQNGREEKRLFFLCMADDDNGYSAKKKLEEYRMKYTAFLREDASADNILSSLLGGEYGLYIDDYTGDVTDELNEKIKKLTGKNAHLLLDGRKDPIDISADGFITVVPDIIVNGTTAAAGVFEKMLSVLEEKGECVVMLEDCWNSTRVVEYTFEYEEKDFVTSNIAYAEW